LGKRKARLFVVRRRSPIAAFGVFLGGRGARSAFGDRLGWNIIGVGAPRGRVSRFLRFPFAAQGAEKILNGELVRRG
jgi:hypothetical protein